MMLVNYYLYIAYQGFIQGRHPGIPPPPNHPSSLRY